MNNSSPSEISEMLERALKIEYQKGFDDGSDHASKDHYLLYDEGYDSGWVACEDASDILSIRELVSLPDMDIRDWLLSLPNEAFHKLKREIDNLDGYKL